MKYCFLDFEYNKTSEKYLNLVCCVTYDNLDFFPRQWWLHKKASTKDALRLYLLDLYERGYVFVSWNAEAEARAFISLEFLRPWEFQWLDLYLEYRMLTNHNHQLQYGKQLIDGKVKKTIPPSKKRWLSDTEIASKNFDKPQHNLAAATYKLTGKIRDTEHKEKMRKLILTAPPQFTAEERKDILDYCEEDVIFLPEILKRIKEEYIKAGIPKDELKNLKKEVLLRGNYAARTAQMMHLGYPINLSWTKSFAKSTKDIVSVVQREINELFPDIRPFEYDKKTGFYVRKEERLRNWISDYVKKENVNWALTPQKKLSLSLDAWEDHFEYRHSYPKDSFAAQIIRLLKLNQSLNGFKPIKPGSKRKSFWECVGSDGRVRPYFGIYSAQSARSQPSSTGFIPLKAAWMRSLIQPPEGKAICTIDYKSEEFLIGGLLAQDMNMIEAYNSGDVYFYFAKQAGAVPKDAKREDYEDIRDKFKSTTLGIQYRMGNASLAKKITRDTGTYTTEEEAQGLIDMYNEIFWRYAEFIEETLAFYNDYGYLKLPCGWYMFGDNENYRSVANFPVQGTGSSVMRNAVKLAQDAGLNIIYTLHDALSMEYHTVNFAAVDALAECMKEGFRQIFKNHPMEKYANVGLDINIWSNDFPKEEKIVKS